MKTLLNLLNRTANAAKISGGGNSRTTKHLFAIIALLLTFGVGNAWGGDNQCGFWGESESYVKFWVNGETVTFTCRPDGVSDLELGYVDHMYLSEIRALTWKYNDGNVCNVTMHYGINTSRHGSTGSDYTANYNNDGYKDWTGKEGDDKDKTIQQFKIRPSGLNLVEGLTPGQSYYLDFYLELQGNLSNSSECYGDQRHRNNNGGNYHIHFTVSDSKSKFTKGSFLYFDARNLTNWKAKAFDTKFFFKKHNNPWSDIADANGECLSTNALEDWVYYIQIPDGEDANYAYEGAVQINRVRPEGDPDENYWWNNTNIALAGTRANANQNCLTGSGDAGSNWDPTWTTYCPPMSSVSLSDNGTTNWGGNGSSETPYLVPTGGDIKVHVTASASALDDANMTRYFLFKKESSAIGEGSASTEKTITASSTTGIKEAVIVEAYNYYNSTEGTHLPSSAIYYEARTPYTISYSKGSPSDKINGSRGSDTKLKDVTFTLPGAIFTRTGYTQTGWATSDGGTKAYDLSASYTDNAAVTLYPHWTPKPYTIRLEGMEADEGNVPIDVNVTYDGVLSHVTPHTKTNYTFDGYWVRNESTHALETQLIDANGNWIKDVTGYTSSDGAGNSTWVHDYAISLYAKWTETIRTVNIAVEGEGSVQINSENVTSFNAGFVTPSAALTAVPANAAWVFKEWRFTKVEEDFQVYVADPLTYSSTSNPVVVNAIANTTLTAVFEHRYNLLGSKYEQGKDRTAMTSGGMPGWTYGSGADFTIHSYDAEGDNATVNMSYTCNLDAGTYMFEIHDRQKGESLGRKNGEAIYVLADRGSVELRGGEDKDQSIFFYPQHAGQYTFRITSMTKDGDYYYPTVTIERPHQMHFAHKRVDIDGDDHNDDLGGTLTATINGASAIDEQWFDYGSDVDWTATAETGYSLTWYTDNAYSNAMNPQPGASWSDPDITHDENIYAKFTEKTTTVSLENDGHGKVQIGGVDKTGTTVGVTTTRSLTAVPNDGYAFKDWSKPSGDDITLSSTSANPTTLTGVGAGLNEGQRVYASFSEIARTITASAGTGGTVGAASYTAYIDTKADISATPATGYKFKEWQETGGTSNVTFDDVHSASTKIKATGDATIQAVFEPRWAIAGSWKTYPESAAWDADTYKLGNIGTNGSSKDTCYVEITLPANTNLTFKIVDRGEDGTVGVRSYVDYGNNTTATQYMKYNNHTNWVFGLKISGYYDCGITTTGGGAYKFAFNITDKSLTVTYQTSYQSNFGWKYADGSGTLHDGDNGGTITVTASDGGSHTISSGQWVAAGANITYTASPAVGYAFAGWHTDDTYGTWFSNNNPWTNSDIKAASNAYAKFVPVTVTYNDESGDGKWSTASNWSPACVPTIDHDVVITKPVTVDIAHATAKSIVLDQNSHTGKLTIEANKGLEVVGTVTRTTDGSNRLATRPEDLILESSSAGNASLIFNNSNSCKATVQMYSIGDIVDANTWNWQFMGTPFTSANALYSYYGSYLYEWKAGGYWDAVANGGTMTPFTGYCITQDGPTTYVMDGTLNPNDDVEIDIPASLEFVMANSWTAPISVHNFTNTTLPLDDKTIYLFNTGFAPEESGDAKQGTAAGTYIAMPISSAIYTGNYLIAPMEGFYVDNRGHDAATITLKYNELVRPQVSRDIVAGAMHAPKRAVAAENEPAVMKIKATGSRYSERIVILARQDFSSGFDNGWDGKNLNEPGVAPILYALREDGTKDAVSAIPTYEGTVVGFRIGEDNNYTFSFNYDGEDIWYLNDLKEEKSTLIDAANTYSFVAEAGDAEARFIISATPIQKLPTGIGNDANDAMVKVRKLIINDQLFIIRAGRMYNAVGSIVK